MDAVAEAGGVTREPKPCRCGKPRTTLAVPGNTITWHATSDGVTSFIKQTLSVTLCLFCDGGVEWKPVEVAS